MIGTRREGCGLLCAIVLSLIVGGECLGEDQDWLEKDSTRPVKQADMAPTQQLLTPAGKQVELPGMRPQVLALSPDGKLLVTSGETHELVTIDPGSGAVLQHVGLIGANGKPDSQADVSFTGLVFSPDGSRIYLSSRVGNIQVFSVDGDHRVRATGVIGLPGSGMKDHPADLPAGLAVNADGTRLYAALNISNRLVEIDAVSGKLLRTFDVGNAPYDVVLWRHKAYVSNWGGRRVDAETLAGPIGKTGSVRVDPVRFIANEGSVSAIDLDAGKTTKEIVVGMHSCAMIVVNDDLNVANANSDSLSIIDCKTDRVVQTMPMGSGPENLFGASPDALAYDPSSVKLYVCNAAQNAIEVIDLASEVARRGQLIPTGWFPAAMVVDPARKMIYVANLKGTGSGKKAQPGDKGKFNSHEFNGSVSLIQEPDLAELARMTEQVHENDRRRAALAALSKPRSNAAPLPVPERVGEPSVFKHVVYVIKENRTYDQVLGDMREGNGEASLCVYGEKVTPNQHRMARDFVLLDNIYCAGASSAEGHQWADSAFCTDYVERGYATDFARAYPDGRSESDADAMAYAPSGFIWDNVLAHGKTLRDYGEFSISTSGWVDRANAKYPRFEDYWRDYLSRAGKLRIGSRPSIPSLANYLDRDTVGWDLDIPDQVRASRFIDELHAFEKAGKFPEMCIIWLPNDHTSATVAGSPTPRAQVADNDLALGKIVEAISHSAFWKDTCIFAIEDDTQDGWDHVNAFRTTAFVISPYTKRHAVVHENYSQPGLMHTMELILGLPPMNQLDAQGRALRECFTEKADFSTWGAVTNQTPLDEMNPPPSAIGDPVKRKFAMASAKLPLDVPDACPEGLLNLILWTEAKGSGVAYPGKEKETDADDDEKKEDDDH